MVRPSSERASQARKRLETEANVWIASASADGVPHLVPLSLAWIDDLIVVATPSDTPTARNIAANGHARAALDSADDVVLFDTDAQAFEFTDAEATLVDRYIERVGWDPRDNPGTWSLLVLMPRRGHAWNGPAEITGRTIVRDETWTDR